VPAARGLARSNLGPERAQRYDAEGTRAASRLRERTQSAAHEAALGERRAATRRCSSTARDRIVVCVVNAELARLFIAVNASTTLHRRCLAKLATMLVEIPS
jgi:hypothetical protein